VLLKASFFRSYFRSQGCVLRAPLASPPICWGHAFGTLICSANQTPQLNITNRCGCQASRLQALRNSVYLLLLVISGKPEKAAKLCAVHDTGLIRVHAPSAAAAASNTPATLLTPHLSAA